MSEKAGKLIIAPDIQYSMDCMETNLNNNVLVVGCSGSGKTRGIVIPNLLNATGSYLVSDPKGNLYYQYKKYLENRGYEVHYIDFYNPTESESYNMFDYIHNTQDITQIAHLLCFSTGITATEPFWDQAVQLLLESLIGYLWLQYPKYECTLTNVMELADCLKINEADPRESLPLDVIMDELERIMPGNYATKQYRRFRLAASNTLRSIVISFFAKLSCYDSNEMKKILKKSSFSFRTIGTKKTAIFIHTSDTDRSMDNLANVFLSQAITELCSVADKECENYTLPLPVRFILDDFATNIHITEFPRMISSFRSRNISSTIIVQAESQLFQRYEDDAQTIISNCDTYVYLGGNDVSTAMSVAKRCGVDFYQVLNMPLNNMWIMRRGSKPIYREQTVADIDDYFNRISIGKIIG